MKKLFRKAITVLGGAALIGSTVGIAAAASYPEPFTSNTAIVVGANAALSDNLAATNIAADLDANAVTTGTTTISTDGDSYKFEKTSTKLHLGDSITSIKTDLDEDEMPVLLNDGTYTDSDNDEFDFTQKITMTSASLSMFDDNDYSSDDPSVGIKYNSGDTVLTYELEFTDLPLIADMDSTDLTIMGKEYYVLDAAYNQLTLLDAASDAIVAEGETSTITAGGKTYTVSIEYVADGSTKLNVNGEITNTLAPGETYKLDDGSYLGLKEVLYSAKDTGISKVEFSIGNGKLILGDDGDTVQMNEDNVDGVTSTITNSTTSMEKVSITWATDDEEFVADDSVVTMPGFEAVSLSFTGLEYPTEEVVELAAEGDESLVLKNFPLKDSTEDINLLYTSGGAGFVGLGKDSDEQLVTGTTSISFDGDTDSYFVASWTDGRDAESYLMRATNFKIDDSVNKTSFQYMKDGSWTDVKTDRKATDEFSLGNVELTVGAINKVDKTVAVTNASTQTSFDTLYSAEGLKVMLPLDSLTSTTSPYINLSAATAPTSYVVKFVEEDKDGDIAQGDAFNATATVASSKVTVGTVYGEAGAAEIGDTDVYRDFIYSALATEILHDRSDSDQKSVKFMYHGDEVEAGVYLTSADAVMMDGEDAGVMTVKDSEVSTVSGKNLVVVGGSAINSVAAELLGGAYSEAMFTSATGVGAGEFLIQSFDRAGKTALLVAGYNAADTEKAATYLLNNDVDTTVGTKMKGTSATEATVVTA
jgi:hypothetical protein